MDSWIGFTDLSFRSKKRAFTPSGGLYLAGLLALIPAVAILLVRIGINAPFAPNLPYSAVYDQVAISALVGPALGAIVVSITTDDGLRRVVMSFAGVFGLLGAIARPALVPASITIVFAAGVLVFAHQNRSTSPDRVAESVVGFGFLTGIFLSMAGNLGIAPVTTRPLGTLVSLLAIAVSPVFVDWNWRTGTVGIAVGAIIGWFGLQEPFITGAATLVGGGIIGVSLPILVLGVIGGTTVIATGLQRYSPRPVIAGLLFLVAGIPATVPRGLAILIGLAILLEERSHP